VHVGLLAVAGDLLAVDPARPVLAADDQAVDRLAFQVAQGLSTLAFSLRTSSGSKLAGGSIATRASTWSSWFWKMSRMAPAVS
jgi:hypothetical protein